MNHRNSFQSVYGGGRNSPYTATQSDGRTFSELYEYVSSGDPMNGYGRGSASELPPAEDEDSPDVIHVRHMASMFRIEFPAYSISESNVLTGDLRRKVADRLGQDPRKVRLVYKEQDLKADHHPIKHYGCKQNSEIAVVVTEILRDYGTSRDPSEEDSGYGSSLRPATTNERRMRPRGNSSVRYREEEFANPGDLFNEFLHPSTQGRSTREDRTSRHTRGSSRHRSPSPAPPRARSPAPPQASASAVPRSPPGPQADPSSPLGKVQALRNQYYDKWLPECNGFLQDPPADRQQREKEYRRISESVMKNIIEAADAIELQGDQTARSERKKMLNEASDILKRLDATKGR